jgi:hypothetical protein
MKSFLILLFLSSVFTYDRNAAVKYAYKHVFNINHKCGSGRWKCTPYGYFGNEHCNYKRDNGDCANFVSQCLLAGGHKPLKGGQCRGIPCGKEEIGAYKLAVCLRKTFGWKRACGYRMPPPSWIQKGDVLMYHSGSCDSGKAHATLVTVAGKNAKITGHSNEVKDKDYTYNANSKPYYEWLHFQG